MTQGYRFKGGAPRLEALPVSCKHCLAGVVNLEDSAINYNEGDSLIPPHLHVNLIYRCVDCEGRFVVRGSLLPTELYYGDMTVDGVVFDNEGAEQETSAALRSGESIIKAVRLAKRAEVEAAGVPFE